MCVMTIGKKAKNLKKGRGEGVDGKVRNVEREEEIIILKNNKNKSVL